MGTSTKLFPVATALLLLAGCQKDASSSAAPSASALSATPASASASPHPSAMVVAAPVSPDDVAKVVNPKGEEPYGGKVGTLTGRITVSGDEPPETRITFPPSCKGAEESYGRLFRVGDDHALADAMVAVTNYKGYVPAKEDAEKVTIQGCAFNRNTIAMAFGQRLEVANLDKQKSHMPYLDGAPFRAVMVAVPGGEPVKLYPKEPGRHLLRDQLPHPFLVANVFVVPYATHDVTGLDGRYKITGIPVGKVTVNAFLPVVRKTAAQEIEIKEGENQLDLTIEYDRKTDQPEKIPEPIFGERAPQ